VPVFFYLTGKKNLEKKKAPLEKNNKKKRFEEKTLWEKNFSYKKKETGSEPLAYDSTENAKSTDTPIKLHKGDPKSMSRSNLGTLFVSQ